MQVETFQIYCDIVKNKSFSKGAEMNAVSQSMASHAVAQLEAYFDTRLINRSLRPWSLTDSGKIIYDRLSHVLDELRKVEENIKSHKVQCDEIRMSCIYSVNLYLMKSIVETFHSRVSEVRLMMDFCHPNKIMEQIRKNEIHLGVVSFVPKYKDVQVISWQEEVFVLVLPHALKHDPIMSQSWTELLSTQPLIHFEKGLMIRKEIDKVLKLHNIYPKIAYEFDNIEAIKRAVESGSGLSILPLPVLKNEIKSQTLTYRNILNGEFKRPINIVFKRLNTSILEPLISMMLNESRQLTCDVLTDAVP